MKACDVFLETGRKVQRVGLLRFETRGRTARCDFKYDESYLEQGDAFALDPVQLPLGLQTFVPPEGFEIFNGFRDAAPDGWGRFVLEKLALHPMDEFDFLVASGSDRVGALSFRSVGKTPLAASDYLDLDELKELLAYYDHPDVLHERWRDHLARGSSLGGARPKATVHHEGRLWLAKFVRQGDRFNVVRAEYATMELARTCGLRVPETRLLTLLGKDVYLIERFDRVVGSHETLRIPFISALTLLGAHESESSRYGYVDIVAHVRSQGVNVQSSAKELFLRAAFNILVNNNDDHLRNHGFLRSGLGWILSPLYDVVPFPQISSERFLALKVGPEGRRATLANLVASCRAFGLSVQEATNLVEALRGQVAHWKAAFAANGVSQGDIDLLCSAFEGGK